MPPKKKKSNHLQDFVARNASLLDELGWKCAADIPANEVKLAYGVGYEGSPFNKYGACQRKAGLDVSVSTPSSSAWSAAAKGKSKVKDKDDNCSSDACGNRTLCLNHLGQSLWADRDKALKAFLKVHGVGTDPLLDSRDATTPVGLKNLGATCYANSYLQCWFQNLDFRAGVFRCPVNIPSGSNVSLENLPLYQLQVTFAALQQGATSVFNPKPLVQSLRLDEGEQQDATEFGKLFMTLLDTHFKKQADPTLRTLVTDLFEGSIVYGTECHNCGNKSENVTPFLELEVTLKANCTLAEQLDKMLADERLTGQNKYMCSSCDSLSDATRYVRLESLPPVLHFSLLRFVFDEKTFDRRKSNSTIRYPPTIDMSAVCPQAGRTLDGAMYDLKGVLLHKGSSAHHGHYVAQVYDEIRNQWYLCDDEEVQSIASIISKKPTAKTSTSSKPTPVEKGQARIKVSGNGVIDLTGTEPEENEAPPSGKAGEYASSKDAYMLIYTKRQSVSQASTVRTEPDVLSPVREKIEQMHVDFEKSREWYLERKGQVAVDFEAALQERQKIWNVWNVTEDDEPTCFVSKSSLQEWVERGIKPPPKVKPKKVNEVKALQVDQSSPAKPGGCANGEREAAQSTTTSRAPSPDGIDIESATKEASKPTDGTNPIEANLPDETLSFSHTNGTSPSKIIDNTPVTCIHGKLDPIKAEQSKQISQLALLNFQDIGIEVQPLISSEAAFCAACVWSRLTAGVYESTHKKHVAAFRSGDKVQLDDARTWISRRWLSDWIKLNPDMHFPGTGQDPQPDSGVWREDTTCEHGNLKPSLSSRKAISTSAANVLRGIFPDWRPFTVHDAKCIICKGAEDDIGDIALRALADEQKKALGQIANSPDRMHTFQVSYGCSSFIIPKEWIKGWRAWVKNPANCDRMDSPDLSNAFCQHNLLLVDVGDKRERDEWSVVTDNELAIIKRYYPMDCEIEVIADANLEIISQPPLCKPCREERLRDFVSADILVKSLSDSDFDNRGNKRATAQNSSDGSAAGSEASFGDQARANGSKKRPREEPMVPLSSSRTTRKPTTRSARRAGDEHKEQAFTVFKLDTVKDLKIQISKAWNIATIYQRLFFNDRELDNDETMASIQILANSVIECYEQVITDERAALDKLNDASDAFRRSKRARPEGFLATGLHGFETESASESEMHVDAPHQNGSLDMAPASSSLVKTCALCTYENTFDNDEDAVSCQVCNEAF